MNNFWDDRYSKPEYVYGTLPNEFFKEEISGLKPGRLLLLGEGEGRNAVFASKLGWKVDAFDSSSKAKEKALKLAAESKTQINYTVISIEDLQIDPASYDAVGIIFLHTHGNLREKLHSLAADALKPGGKLIIELFSKNQVKKTSGGPKELEQLYSKEEIEQSFQNFRADKLLETEINLNEGSYHSGEASVIRFLGTKI